MGTMSLITLKFVASFRSVPIRQESTLTMNSEELDYPVGYRLTLRHCAAFAFHRSIILTFLSTFDEFENVDPDFCSKMWNRRSALATAVMPPTQKIKSVRVTRIHNQSLWEAYCHIFIHSINQIVRIPRLNPINLNARHPPTWFVWSNNSFVEIPLKS